MRNLTTALLPLRDLPCPWMVAGGWAIDLFLGRPTREHKDVDVAIFRPDQLTLQRHLAGWQMYIAASGTLNPWPEGHYIELPLHGIWAWRPGVEGGHLDLQPDLEFLLNECTSDHWVYRRDPAITLPLSLACLRTPGGIPYLAPEIVLLYKLKSPRDTDLADLAAVRGALSGEQIEWLRQALGNRSSAI